MTSPLSLSVIRAAREQNKYCDTYWIINEFEAKGLPSDTVGMQRFRGHVK